MLCSLFDLIFIHFSFYLFLKNENTEFDVMMLSSDVAGVLQEAGDAYSRART